MSAEMKAALERALEKSYELEAAGFPRVEIESNVSAGFVLIDATDPHGQPWMWVFPTTD